MSDFPPSGGDDKKMDKSFLQGAWVKVTAFSFLTRKIHFPVIWTQEEKTRGDKRKPWILPCGTHFQNRFPEPV